jgi:hypothetical protein
VDVPLRRTGVPEGWFELDGTLLRAAWEVT